MLSTVPIYLPIVFGLCALFTFGGFYYIIKQSKPFGSKANFIMLGLVVWILLQTILALSGFYSNNTMTVPPRFFLAFFPALLLMIGLFFTKKGRAFMDSLPLVPITWLNVVRIPVEFCLYWLFLAKALPELMTFEGRNFDILAGLTAPFIAYFGLQQQRWSRRVVLIWNIVTLGLLMNVIIHGILSAPTILQRFAFEQPNIAILHFPYVLLPALIVSVVLFGHLVSIRQLTKKAID